MFSTGKFFKQPKVLPKFNTPVQAKVNSNFSRRYHENVLDHFEKPRNAGSFDKKAPNVGTGLVGAPACGDVLKLQIKVDDNGVITDSCFLTFGCGSAIASSSLATELIKGKKLDEAVQIKNQDIAKHLALPPVKLHCSMLAEDAIKAAVNDLKKKKQEEQNTLLTQVIPNGFKVLLMRVTQIQIF